MIFHIPFSGSEIPRVYDLDFDISKDELISKSDKFLDELVKTPLYLQIKSKWSRLFCDMNTQRENAVTNKDLESERILSEYYDLHQKMLGDACVNSLHLNPSLVLVHFVSCEDNDFEIYYNEDEIEHLATLIKDHLTEYKVKTKKETFANMENDSGKIYQLEIRVNKKLFRDGNEKSDNFIKIKNIFDELFAFINKFEEEMEDKNNEKKKENSDIVAEIVDSK